MLFSAKEMILKRKSVRTFDGKGLSDDDLAFLEETIRNLSVPFSVQPQFRILNAKEYGLSSPVVVGEEWYLLGKIEKKAQWELSYGYALEYLCLAALSRKIGTVIIAGTLNRPVFEKAIDVKDHEIMPAVTPLGIPAEKRSLREILMRKGIHADDRIPYESMVGYEPDCVLTEADAALFREALEMARLAPSAVNRQPARAVINGNTVDFYEEKSLKENELGDIQKVDLGAAVCHFDLVMQENGASGRFEYDPEKAGNPFEREYIISWKKD